MRLADLNKKQREAAFKSYDYFHDKYAVVDYYKTYGRQAACEKWIQSWETKERFLTYLREIGYLD